MNNKEIYSAITEKIIANLEKAGSWSKLWSVSPMISLNGHYYRGINRLILSGGPYKSSVYGTFQQIRENGGMVRKGEKATMITLFKKIVHENEAGEKKAIPLLRYFFVFNTEQADFDEKGKEKIALLNKEVEAKVYFDHKPAQDIIDNFPEKPGINHNSLEDEAYYSPIADVITVPDIKYFKTSEAYYRVMFHEMGHSTGHPKRLNRFEGMTSRFKSIAYSKEELVAELCSSYLAGIANLDDEIRNSAAYIRGWSDRLRDNQDWISWAASRAEKAANHILGINESDAEVVQEVIEEPVKA